MKQPIAGIKGSPRGSLSKEEVRKLDREYRVHRNEQLRLKNLREAMLIARARGDLVSKAVAQSQAGFLIVALRQRLLGIPQTYSRRLLNISAFDVMSAKLKEMSLSILKEIEQLARAVTEPGWVDRGEGEEKDA